MVQRLLLAGVVAFALVASGCSGSKTTINTPSSKPSSSSASSSESTAASAEPTLEPQDRLDPDACVDVTSANLDLAVATNAQDAQKAADVFDKYSPPKSVQEAIDHFVGTGGVHYDDPDYDKFNDRIDNWVKAVCPL